MGGTGVGLFPCWRELPIVTWILLAFVTVADLLATRGFEPKLDMTLRQFLQKQ